MAQKDVGNKIPIYKLKTTDEVMKYYDEWGDKDKYNKDMVDWNYTGPKETVATFNKHEKNKDTPYIMGADKDYMQPAEFIIDCKINKVISCAYSDGGLGRMDAGDVVGVLSNIQNMKDEVPHVWSW